LHSSKPWQFSYLKFDLVNPDIARTVSAFDLVLGLLMEALFTFQFLHLLKWSQRKVYYL
jgi:hypothetical protein